MKACADEIVAEHPGHAHTLRLVTPHWLRHSFAFEMLAGGASLFAVQAQLGHTSPATTQVYVHLLMQDRQQALRAAAANRARGDKVG
jgi:integrase/recombinase XerD